METQFSVCQLSSTASNSPLSPHSHGVPASFNSDTGYNTAISLWDGHCTRCRASASGRAGRALALPLFSLEHFTQGHARPRAFVGSFPGFINSKACMGMRLTRLHLT